MNSFTLIPFNENAAPSVGVTGKIERNDNQLKIEYNLERSHPLQSLQQVTNPQRAVSQVIIPEAVNNSTRQFDLWEHTCFEFFLGSRDSSQYWEFNLSPSGNWNVFRFPNYRQDIAEEMAFNKLPFQVLHDNSLQVMAKIDLDKIIAPEQNIDVGITTVVEDKDANLSYWALSHPGKEADFHLRNSFAIAL